MAEPQDGREGQEPPTTKIPTMPVKSDGIMWVDDEGKVGPKDKEYALHDGETVHILPTTSMGEHMVMSELSSMESPPDNATVEELAAYNKEMLPKIMNLALMLSKRVVSWDWTDIVGVPMEQPYGNPAAIMALQNVEMLFLVTATQGEVTAQRGNGSTGSPATSSTKRGKSRSRGK